MDIIIDNIGQKLNMQIKESFEIIKKNKNRDLNEEYENNDESSESNSFSDEDEGNNDKTDIPDWYNIKNISNETIKEIKVFLKKEKWDIKILKHLIKKITKLFLIYERINKFGFSMKDCNDFIDFNFNAKDEIYKILQEKILTNSKEEEKNKFFLMILKVILGK
jgi:hypothetical protein